MNNPAVSIVMPIYNQHNYLRQCLDSVIAQSLKDIEIICVNDGSTDDSLGILKEYSKNDSRIVIIDKPNTGYGDSLNVGFKRATGEYLGIVEPDDFIESYMMEYLYDKAKTNDLDWARGDIFLYSNDGQQESKVRESITYGAEIYDRVLDPRVDISPHRTAVRTWAGIYKRVFVMANGIKCNATPGASFQDIGFFLKTLFYARRVMFVNVAFYNWRQDNPNSSSHYDMKRVLELTDKEYSLVQRYVQSHRELCRYAVASHYYNKFQSYSYISLKLHGDEKKELFNRLSKEFAKARRERKVDRRFFTRIEWLLFKSLSVNAGIYTVIGLFFVSMNDVKRHGIKHAFRLGMGWIKNYVRR